MKRLSGLLAVLLAVPVSWGGLAPAAAAGPGENSRTIRVDAECAGGGRVSLAHTTEAGATHVQVRAGNLRNGTWRGVHMLEVGVDDTTDTELAVRVRDRRTSFDFDVEDTGKAGVLDMNKGKRQCFASFDEYPRGTIMGSAQDSIAVWHPQPRRYVTRGQVECRPGSEWYVEVGVGFEDWGFGSGSRPHTCGRLGFFRFTHESRTGEPGGAPVELTYKARNLDTGAVRRLTFHASSPAA